MIKIDIVFLTTCVIAATIVEANYQLEEIVDTKVDSLNPEIVEYQFDENSHRLGSLENDGNWKIGDPENRHVNPKSAEESHQKVMKFGKRVLDTIKKYKILKNEIKRLKSGHYRIDWWKKDRRLERMRRRLLEELARKPELENHLNRLGWNATIEDNKIPKKTSLFENKDVKKAAFKSRNSCENSLLYKALAGNFEDPTSFDLDKLDEKSTNEEPAIFVYMKIVLPKPKKINRKDGTAKSGMADSPMKFNLDTLEQSGHPDFDTSRIGIVDVESQDPLITNSIDSSSVNEDGESIDTDRLLQLIPLIVDELHNDRLSNEEKRALSWIFGKRLWLLLEREGSKKPDETMDKDLAIFLVKGELPENETSELRRRRLIKTSFGRFDENRDSEIPIFRDDRSINTDHDLNSINENYEKKRAPKISTMRNFYRDYYEKMNDRMSLLELIDFSAAKREKRHESNEMKEKSRK